MTIYSGCDLWGQIIGRFLQLLYRKNTGYSDGTIIAVVFSKYVNCANVCFVRRIKKLWKRF